MNKSLQNHLICLVLFCLLSGNRLFGQSVGINEDGAAPDSSSILDIKSTSKGLLIPRMTEKERKNIENPADGLIVYQTDEVKGLYYYDKTEATEDKWKPVKGKGGGTFEETDPKIGLGTDAKNYVPIWDGGQLIKGSMFDKNGSVGIGTDSPSGSAILDLNSNSKGLLVPRMTEKERNKIKSPDEGLMVYQKGEGFYYYNEDWKPLQSSNGGGITEEKDPEVGENYENYVPRWDGSKLVSGSIYDDGNSIFILGDLFPNHNLQISGNTFFAGVGYFYDSEFSNLKVNISTNDNGGGQVITYGANKEPNVSIADNGGNNGYVAVHDANGNALAQMYANESGEGIIYGTTFYGTSFNGTNLSISGTKNFVVDHPLDNTKQIAYASVEGPEAAMYIRGTSRLINGNATIALPEHFRVLAVEKSMTVLLTPLAASSKGLAVTSKKLEGIVVQELLDGKGNYEFDWEVKCVRQGFEDFQVVRQKGGKGSVMAPARIAPSAKKAPQPPKKE